MWVCGVVLWYGCWLVWVQYCLQVSVLWQVGVMLYLVLCILEQDVWCVLEVYFNYQYLVGIEFVGDFVVDVWQGFDVIMVELVFVFQ